VPNAQIDGEDLCLESGIYGEVAAQNVESDSTLDPAYYPTGSTTPPLYDSASVSSDPYYTPTTPPPPPCEPLKVCDVVEKVRESCARLVGCVAFNYDAGCGVLKKGKSYRTPSDNGITIVEHMNY
jgi:hypothetical protein